MWRGMSVGVFKYSSANKIVFIFCSFYAPPPKSYSSALAKAFCHDDGVFDPELNVLLQAVPPTDMLRNSLSVLRSFSAVFCR